MKADAKVLTTDEMSALTTAIMIAVAVWESLSLSAPKAE